MFFFFCSIVKVRETRLTGFLSSTLIALSLLMLPIPLTLIPTPVLDGLFLFMAMTSLYGNQMFERALLLVTEQVGRISNSFVTGLCPNRVQLSQMSKVHLSHIVLLSGRAFQSYVPWIFEIQSVQLIIWRAQPCVCKYCLFSWWLRLVLILKNHYGFPLWTFLWFNFMLIWRQNFLYLIKLAPKS